MPKQPADYRDHFPTVCEGLARGALIVSLDEFAKANPMTIGWGAMGLIWGKPIWVVLVRESRYTHQCLERTGDFTVNIAYPDLQEAVDFCGSNSGRDFDKMERCALTARPSQHIQSPGIEECGLIYECRVVQKTDVVPEYFAPDIRQGCYPQGDFHRVYFGEILATWADDPLRF